MNLNNLGMATVADEKLGDYTETLMNYEVKDATGGSLTGSIDPSKYVSVDPPGKAPWSVAMGLPNANGQGISNGASVSGLTQADSVVSCLVLWPQGPNQNKLFVDERD